MAIGVWWVVVVGGGHVPVLACLGLEGLNADSPLLDSR